MSETPITLTDGEWFYEDEDDEPAGPWCEIHEAPHLAGGLACELRQAEAWLA